LPLENTDDGGGRRATEGRVRVPFRVFPSPAKRTPGGRRVEQLGEFFITEARTILED